MSEQFQQVHRIALSLVRRLPDTVLAEDLVQAGMVGLLEARQRYTGRSSASFSTFAGARIYGAMLDEIRRSDWTPRSVHRVRRQVEEAVQRIEGREGREALPQEIADELGIALDEYRKIQADLACIRVTSLEEVFPDERGVESLPGSAPGPQESLQQYDQWRQLGRYMKHLPERERALVLMYYDDDKTMREIAEVFGFSESRAVQVHKKAINRIRSWIRNDNEVTECDSRA